MSKHDKKTGAIFRKQALSIHQKIKSGAIQPYFATHPDENASTYYQKPMNSGKTNFSFFENESPTALQGEMEQLWTQLDNQELVPLAKDLSKLAFDFKSDQMEQANDVSEYVYVMY